MADLDGETLARRTGEVVRLRPQAFAILRYLIEHANRLVTKTELIRAVWGATAVTDDSLVQGILEIRRALDDGSHSVVATVMGRGYRLVLPEPLQYTPNRPSLAVLPFVNLDADPAHDRFADGLAGSIISAASRIADLSVIAHSAALDARPRTAANWPATEWNVTRYRLEGSIQGSAGRLRINAQLTEAASAAHVWAQTFDGESGDRFVLQDQFTESIVGALQPSIRRAEIERALRKRLEDLDSWDLYLRAVPPTHANSPEATVTALSLLGRSLQLEPKHFASHAYAAWCHEQ
ncbi:MAG: winged helix-turn-helix domain-containing protein, partial [Methyloceanibacter sp.]|uniref:winged helix-turn-helix domain-containing protein n=1 Tax=Methyloceanibacter sp. TaxID=1965321 RepID=UPI003EE41D88